MFARLLWGCALLWCVVHHGRISLVETSGRLCGQRDLRWGCRRPLPGSGYRGLAFGSPRAQRADYTAVVWHSSLMW
jgi:hypothetical protein